MRDFNMKRMLLLTIVLLIISSFFIGYKNPEMGKNDIQKKEASYQNLKYSKNGENHIYTGFNDNSNHQVICIIDGKPEVVAEDEFIKFSPVVNDKGDYAYAVSEWSTSESKIYFNNKSKSLSLEKGLYKNLAISNKYLVFSCTRLYDDKEFLIIYNIDNQDIKSICVEGYIQKTGFIDDSRILIEIWSNQTISRDVLQFDIVKDEEPKPLINSTGTEIIGSINRDGTFTLNEVTGDRNAMYLFNAYSMIYSSINNNNLSLGNNFMGRISWNEVYRILGLSKLYEKTRDNDAKDEVKQIIYNVLAHNNEKYNLNGIQNPSFAWATTKYSIDRQTPISLIVDDALIYYALINAINSKAFNDSAAINKIIDNAISFYNYHEQYFSQKSNLYRIQEDIQFHLDGVVAPFNWNNAFGLMLIELYKYTGENKYLNRVLKLAEKFKSEFIFTSDNRILWHYWPKYFYDGWEEGESLSRNKPSMDKQIDSLFEDISHAGINLKFILEFRKNINRDVFTDSDLNLIKNTLKGIIVGNEFSRFMSGDILYQKPSARFIPTFGWAELGDDYLSNIYEKFLPMVYPEFDSQEISIQYLNLIDNPKKSEKIYVKTMYFDSELKFKKIDTKVVLFDEIKSLFVG